MRLKKKVYALIGYPVSHSLSPQMHNAAFKHLGINAEYKLFEVKPEDLEDFLINRKDISGFNITVPHKVRAKEILEQKIKTKSVDRKSIAEKAAQLVGAINTVKRCPEIRFYNTDSVGFLTSLKQDLKFDTKNKTAFVIGCGGAGRSIIGGLVLPESGIKKIYAYDIDDKVKSVCAAHFFRFKYLKNKCEFISKEDIAKKIKESQILINTTPVGMKNSDPLLLDKKLLHKNLSVYDVIYNRKTKLLEDAQSLGLPFSGGLGMLLYQGAAAFKIWTRCDAPLEIMRESLRGDL